MSTVPSPNNESGNAYNHFQMFLCAFNKKKTNHKNKLKHEQKKETNLMKCTDTLVLTHK